MQKIPFAYVVCGLGFGDEGKGTMVDFLCRYHEADLVVRYNGGSQAGHNVVTEDGRHHTFSQIGSGAFIPGVRTLISRFMLWDPIALAHEVAVLSPKISEHALNRHFIDERAPVITPFHVAANRIKEWFREGKRHGSCGKGVGETAFDVIYHPHDVIRAADLFERKRLQIVLKRIQSRKRAEIESLGINLRLVPDEWQEAADLLLSPTHPGELALMYATTASEWNIISEATASAMIRSSVSVFEGAQGVLLDEWHGFHPYTTWSTTTPANAIELLKEADFSGEREIIGVLRTYSTRHGAGPFMPEDKGLHSFYHGGHDGFGEWQGEFRVGGFDGVMLRYAAECVRKSVDLDTIALTWCDIFSRFSSVPYWDRYASESGALMYSINPCFEKNIEYQEQLTQMLQSSSGTPSGSFTSLPHLVRYIEENVKAKVGYVSFGPTANDKNAYRGII